MVPLHIFTGVLEALLFRPAEVRVGFNRCVPEFAAQLKQLRQRAGSIRPDAQNDAQTHVYIFGWLLRKGGGLKGGSHRREKSVSQIQNAP
ncbi:MAG TPA: hypothetical protein VFR84_03540 [Candidatus Angelobacter sp.]|nr:hypothetical protein [Candidatus Angelobacter sp.]